MDLQPTLPTPNDAEVSAKALERPLEQPFTVEEVAEAMRPVLAEREQNRENIKKMGGTAKPTQPIIYTPEAVTNYLNELANCGVSEHAARAWGFRTRQLQWIRKSAPELDELYHEALALYRNRVVRALHVRAVEGVEEPVWYQGEQVGTVRRYSDRLLELSLKHHAPEFRDHSTTDVVHHGGVLLIPATAETREEWLRRREQEALDAGSPPANPQLRESDSADHRSSPGELCAPKQEPSVDGGPLVPLAGRPPEPAHPADS